jgi:hypothetical protein
VFLVLAASTGLRRLGPRVTVAAAVLFAVGPTWGGLMGTVLLPRGRQLMFPLTPTTVTLSLIGHVIFGIVLGLGTVRCRDLESHWAGPRVVDLEKLARWGELPNPVPVPALADIPPSALPRGSRRAAFPAAAAEPALRSAAHRSPAGRLVPGPFPSPTTPARAGGRPWRRPVVPAARTDSGAFEVTVVDATVVEGMAPVPAVLRGGPTPLPWGARPSSRPGDRGRRPGTPALEAADFGLRAARH